MMMRLWNSASVAVHATLSENDDATMVLHVYFISGCFVILNLPAAFARALQKLTSNGLETSVTAADPQQRMVYFDPLSGQQAILEVSVVTATSGGVTGLNLGSRAGQCHDAAGRENEGTTVIASFRRKQNIFH
jgi:hypothetical protein